MSKEKLPGQLGNEFGLGLRNSSQYDDTQRLFQTVGITEAVLNRTPPVGLNLQILSKMDSIFSIQETLKGKPITASILGLAIVDGVEDFQRFIQTALGTTHNQLQVVEIDSAILEQVNRLHLHGVVTLLQDARHTKIQSNSQDLVLRDHLGNCCPPQIDRTINKETFRILKPGGTAIVNITTSELLGQSPDREIVLFETIRNSKPNLLPQLQEGIYDLSQLKKNFGEHFEEIRGKLIEIENSDSFVVFGEDENGHGEWFRLLSDHLGLWQKDGFEILEIKSREGNDSHLPPLRCKRHNVVMRKVQL